MDEDGFAVGAFATVDFDRYSLEFDKARYKADKVREQLRDILIMFNMVKARVPGKVKYTVLKDLRMGRIELDDISDMAMWHLGRLYLRAWRLQKEIVRLQEYSQRRRQRQAEAFFASMG